MAQIINQFIYPDEFCVFQKSMLKKKYVKQLDVYTTEDMRKETLVESYNFEKGVINGYRNANNSNYAVYVRTAYGSRYIDSVVCPTEARISLTYNGPRIKVVYYQYDSVNKSFQANPTIYEIKTNDFAKITAVNAYRLEGKKKVKLYNITYKYEGATVLKSFSGVVAGQKIKGTVESDYSGKIQKVIYPDKEITHKYSKDGLLSQKTVNAKDSEPITYYFKYTFE
ncbi:MAG: hypothetical protein NZ519_01930 [Bacteroidia bacterium]|nr:hypothetical protein [Bacteroidia bacterium]MDW8300930.1 hypothetical protein [Bacteroidia bacterium]